MSASYDELLLRINRLVVRIPRLKREYPEPEFFWSEFAGEADAILDDADQEDLDWAAAMIDRMLVGNGLTT